MATNSSSCSSSSSNQTLPSTSSSCSTQSITATHDFTVSRFSLLDGMGVGRYVSSGTFSVDGTSGSIRLYPDGTGGTTHMEPDPHVSVLLCYLRGPRDTRTKFSCSLLLDDDDQASRTKGETIKEIKVFKECLHTFPSPFSQWWGWPEFILKSKLQSMLQASNDSFTIRCVLTILKYRTEDEDTIAVPPPDLHRDLEKMLNDGDGADVTITVGDRVFRAHKYLLAARSRVFKAQLFGAMKESNTDCLEIEDMEPSVFERLLHFIYTDSLSENDDGDDDDKCVAMLHLLVAADRYGLMRLRLICEEKLRGWIDVQSVATILRLADRHHRLQLKEACLKFMAWPDVLGDIMGTQGFKDLVASCPSVMEEILGTIAWPKLDG